MLSVFSCAEDYLASSYTYVTRIDFCFYTSVTLRATCNNKGDNSLLTKPWIKVPKRSRIEYNRGKPASIIEQALLMPHLYAIYTHGNNDAKITKDIIHSRAYRMKGGVLTYKPFPFVAQKTDFWLNHFIFPRNWLTLQEFLATVDFERWKSNFTKWQIFCPPSFFAIKLVIHVLRYFFGVCCFFTTSPVDCWKSCFTADMWEELFF